MWSTMETIVDSSMKFEKFEAGKSVQQIVDEVTEDLMRGFYDQGDHAEAIAKLVAARVTAKPESDERKVIDRLLADIAQRYGEA